MSPAGVATRVSSLWAGFRRYSSGLQVLACVSIRICGLKSLGGAVLVGALSRFSILATFIMATKLLVFIVTASSVQGELVFLGHSIPVVWFVVLTCVLVTTAFGVAGFLVYMERRLVARNLTQFTRHVRAQKLRRFREEELPTDAAERKARITKYLYQEDPTLRRATRMLLMGGLDISKNTLLSGAVSLVLFVYSPTLFLLLVTVVLVGLPFYVIHTARRANINRVSLKEVDAELDKRRAGLVSSAGDPAVEPASNTGELDEVLLGDLDHERGRVESERYTGALGTYPVIYITLGVAFSALLITFVQQGLPASPDRVTLFVVLGFVLRFLAGTTYGILDGVRLMNSEYFHISAISEAFTQPGARAREVCRLGPAS